MTEMIRTLIADQWVLDLPAHRADRGVWPDDGSDRAGDPLWRWWERERLETMRALLDEGDFIVDVGAEEGDMAALYASWGCFVYLAEPNPLVWPNIRAIFEANDLTGQIAGMLVGFFGETAETLIDMTTSRGIWPEVAYGPVIGDHGFRNLAEANDPDVPQIITTIDERILGKVDAITIDVEGSELRVLRGAERTLRQHRPLVWCSVHPEFMTDMYGDTESDLHDFMADLDYVGFPLAQLHEDHWLFRPRQIIG